MNILISGNDENYCSKLEAQLYSSKLGHDLYVKILDKSVSVAQGLADFAPDILLYRTDSLGEQLERLVSKISNLSPYCKTVIISDNPVVGLYKWSMDNGIYKIIDDADNINAIVNAVSKAYSIVRSNQDSTAELEEKDRFIDYASQKVKSELLRYIMRDCIPDETAWNYPNIIDYTKYKNSDNYCVLVKIDWGDIDDYQKYLLVFSIDKYITNSYFAKLDIPSVFMNDSTLFFVVNDSAEENKGFSINYFRDLMQNSLRGKYRFSIGVSEHFDIRNTNSGFKHSRYAAMLSFYGGWNRIYYYENDMISPDEQLIAYFDRLTAYIKECSLDGIEDSLHEVYDYLAKEHKYDPEEIDSIFSSIFLAFCASFKVDRRELFKSLASNRMYSLKENFDMFTDAINEARSAAGGTPQTGTVNRKMSKILSYINDNYSDRNLTISSIASANGLSRNYLCTLFKQKTGMTINAYIIKLRIEKSCQLLEDKNKKLYDIAYESGFSDPNYFSTVFKKQMGCSPSEYRTINGIK